MALQVDERDRTRNYQVQERMYTSHAHTLILIHVCMRTHTVMHYSYKHSKQHKI